MRQSDERGVPVERLLSHSDFVRRIVRRLVRGDAQVDDVVQDTWLAAVRSPPRRPAGVRAWLAKVAANCARKAFRADRRRTRRERSAAVREAWLPDGDAVDRATASRRVLDAVLALEDPLRTTVLLRHYDGFSAEQIAARFRVTPAAIRKRLHRAEALLRRTVR
jgi:RNA polymerase sigma-70 factor (ECF subfamily)